MILEVSLGMIVFAPAAIAVAALVGAMLLFAWAKPDDSSRLVKLIAAGVLLTLALGIGACYGVVLMG